jgi:phage shock protein A
MMTNTVRRWWAYLATKLRLAVDDAADPKVQLQQAIAAAEDQHRQLKEQAAVVIAHQHRSEARLAESQDRLAMLHRNAQQALIMADDAARSGDTERAERFNAAAESFAVQLVATEADVAALGDLALSSAAAADQARSAVRRNARLLTEKLAEQRQLLSALDQAEMAEQLNAATAALDDGAGGDAPHLRRGARHDRGTRRPSCRGRRARRHPRRRPHGRRRSSRGRRRRRGTAVAAAHPARHRRHRHCPRRRRHTAHATLRRAGVARTRDWT